MRHSHVYVRALSEQKIDKRLINLNPTSFIRYDHAGFQNCLVAWGKVLEISFFDNSIPLERR